MTASDFMILIFLSLDLPQTMMRKHILSEISSTFVFSMLLSQKYQLTHFKKERSLA